MIHIRQKLDISNKIGEVIAYTIVDTTGWTFPLEQHPSIVENPDLFEIVDSEIPEYAQTLIYNNL
jgi:hypothetical protein